MKLYIYEDILNYPYGGGGVCVIAESTEQADELALAWIKNNTTYSANDVTLGKPQEKEIIVGNGYGYIWEL